MVSSGTTSFNPSLGDMVIESYSRCQVRPPSFTADHMLQARNSAQFLLAEWATKPSWPNLWKISLIQIPLIQGVATYAVPSNVVAILDYYIRQFSLQAAASFAPNFSTTISSSTVTVTFPNNGMAAGDWVAIVIPVAVGGLVLLNFYQVVSILDTSNFTIDAGSNASASVSNGGAVPVFDTTATSQTILVTLPNHGLVTNENFSVQASTTVGGLTLSGVYTVTSTPTTSTFTIASTQPAGTTATASENAGLAQIELQNTQNDPQDRVIFPISRSEYSAQPDKFQQAFPTTVWWDRQINSTLTFWQVPDGNGPYTLNYYAMTQIQDAILPGGVTLDLPYRFFEAFAAGLAAKLARKFAPQLVGELRLEAQMAWDGASHQDVEEVPLYITPGIGGYYR